MKIFRQLLMLITCIMVLLVSAMQKEGKVLGHDMSGEGESQEKEVQAEDSLADVETLLDDGTVVVNTTNLCKEVKGYAGTVPMEISIKDGIVTDVKPLEKDETPEFFVEAKVIVAHWKGKTVEEAQSWKWTLSAVPPSLQTPSKRMCMRDWHMWLLILWTNLMTTD